jgi:hypothetical protein
MINSTQIMALRKEFLFHWDKYTSAQGGAGRASVDGSTSLPPQKKNKKNLTPAVFYDTIPVEGRAMSSAGTQGGAT